MQHTLTNQAASPVVRKQWDMSKVGAFFKNVFTGLYSWQWTKGLVYWIILSMGTASDLVFLLASFWMSINSNVHPLVLTYLSEKQATYITYLATSGYVGLPIFIVSLAVVQAVGHIERWNTGGFWSRLWAFIFGVPALIFLLMDFITISCAVANVSFEMPTFFVIVRADSAFIFAFGSLIFFFLGKPRERKRLAEKDGLIASLKAEMAAALVKLTQEKDGLLADLRGEMANFRTLAGQEKDSLLSTIDAKNDEIESLKGLLVEAQRGYTSLHKAVSQSDELALQGYSEDCRAWLKSGLKSANVKDICRYTGFRSDKVTNAIGKGKLQTTARNGELVTITSLTSWLKSLSTQRETEEIPALHLVDA